MTINAYALFGIPLDDTYFFMLLMIKIRLHIIEDRVCNVHANTGHRYPPPFSPEQAKTQSSGAKVVNTVFCSF